MTEELKLLQEVKRLKRSNPKMDEESYPEYIVIEAMQRWADIQCRNKTESLVNEVINYENKISKIRQALKDIRYYVFKDFVESDMSWAAAMTRGVIDAGKDYSEIRKEIEEKLKYL